MPLNLDSDNARSRVFNSPAVAFLIVILAACGLYALMMGHHFVMDEHPHFTLVRDLFNASQSWESVFTFDYSRQLPSMLPGYHWLVVGFLRLLDLPLELDILRLISLALSLITVMVMFWVARATVPDRSAIRTLQFAALPMCFPLLPLLYTDVVSLLFVLLAAGFYCRQHLLMAGVMASLALLLRQTNIAWLLLILLMAYVDQFGYRLQWKGLPAFLCRASAFLAGGALFLAFILWNEGISIGMHRSKQEITWNTCNVFFFMQSFFFMFLPWLFIRWREIARSFTVWKTWVWLGALLLLYVLTNHPFHPWNTFAPNLLRNQVIGIIRYNEWTFLAGFIPVAISAVVLRSWPMSSPAAWCLLPCALLVLLPAPLVDFRYYLPIGMFLLLFTKPQSMRSETVLCLWLSLLSGFVAAGHVQGWFAI